MDLFPLDLGALLPALIAAAAAGLVTNLLVPPVTRLAHLLRAYDQPGGRRRQLVPTPRLGGLAVGVGIAVAGGGALLVAWRQVGLEIGRAEMIAMALATGTVFLVGALDDLFGVEVWKKFLVQAAAASLMVGVGWTVDAVSVPWGGSVHLGWLGGVAAVVWIVGVTNALNLLDGLDGLAGGVAAIIAVSLAVYAALLGNAATVLLMAAVAGACLGFLRHNWAPARIYLGDSGSLTLGFLFGAMSVHSSIKAPAAVAILVPVLALGIPVIDTLLVMTLRFVTRPHGPAANRLLAMFHADRNHLHHLLLHWRDSHARVAGTLYAVVFLSCSLALVVAITRDPQLGALVLALELTVVLAMRRLGLRRRLDRVVARAMAALGDDEEDEAAAERPVGLREVS